MPFFAGNVTTDFAFAHGLHNTDIVQVVLDKVGTRWSATGPVSRST